MVLSLPSYLRLFCRVDNLRSLKHYQNAVALAELTSNEQRARVLLLSRRR